jgi:hypothetical protein
LSSLFKRLYQREDGFRRRVRLDSGRQQRNEADTQFKKPVRKELSNTPQTITRRTTKIVMEEKNNKKMLNDGLINDADLSW